MAGQGIKLFASGDVLSAAEINGYLMDQSVARFATTTARDLAFGGLNQPTLSEGRICYIDASNLIQFYDGTQWQDSAQFTVGDGTITTVKLADDAVTSAKIADGAITAAHIADGTIIAADIADGSVTSAKILDGTIVDADINAAAAIALSKLASGTSGQIIVHSSGGVPTATTVSGDVTIDSTGNVQIAADKIVNADINSAAAIADTKLATISTAGKVSNSATTADSANTASAIVARDAAGKVALTAIDVNIVIETASIVASPATGTINIDFSTNPTVYYTANATNDWTLNVRGTSGVTLNNTLTTGQIATVTFLATIGATQKRPTVFQVDGSAVTPKWMGGTAPATGNASSIDAYTLSIIKTGSAAFTVLASQTKFA